MLTPEQLADAHARAQQKDIDTYLGEGVKTNALVSEYRQRLAEKGYQDSRSDAQLTLDIFARMRERGKGFSMEERYPDFRDQALDIQLKLEDSGGFEQFGRGLETGGRGMLSSFAGAGAMVSGSEGLMETAVELQANSPHLSVARYEDMFRQSGINWDAAAQYAGGALGQVLPNMVETVATLVLGAKTGGAFAAVATGAKQQVKSQVAKAVRSRLRKGIAKKYKTNPPKYASGPLKGKKMSVEDYAASTYKMYGMTSASALNSYALNSGELYNTMRREGFDHDDSQFYAMSFGTLSALPDTVVPVWAGRQFLKASGLAKASAVEQSKGIQWMGRQMNRLRLSTPAKIGVPMAFEGVTEGFQEYINIVAPIYAQRRKDGLSVGQSWEELGPVGDVAWTPENKSRIVNASILGAISGGLFGVGGAIASRGQNQPIGLEDRPPSEGPQATDIVILEQSDGTTTMARLVSMNDTEATVRPVSSFDSESGVVMATNFGPPVTVPTAQVKHKITASDIEALLPSPPQEPTEDAEEATLSEVTPTTEESAAVEATPSTLPEVAPDDPEFTRLYKLELEAKKEWQAKHEEWQDDPDNEALTQEMDVARDKWRAAEKAATDYALNKKKKKGTWVNATDAAKKLAKENGIDLTEVEGTGKVDLATKTKSITVRDVRQAMAKSKTVAPLSEPAVPSIGGNLERYGEKGKVKVYRGVRKKKGESKEDFNARAKKGIQEGDVVSTSQQEAKRFAGKDGKVLTKTVDKSTLVRKKPTGKSKPNWRWQKSEKLKRSGGVPVTPSTTPEEDQQEDQQEDDEGGAPVSPSEPPKKPKPGAGRRRRKKRKKSGEKGKKKKYRGLIKTHGTQEEVDAGQAVYTTASFEEESKEWQEEAERVVNKTNQNKNPSVRKFRRKFKKKGKYGYEVRPSGGGMVTLLGLDGKGSKDELNYIEAQQILTLLDEEQTNQYLDSIVQKIAPTTNDLSKKEAFDSIVNEIHKLFKKTTKEEQQGWIHVRTALIDRLVARMSEMQEATQIDSLLRRNIRYISLTNNYLKPALNITVESDMAGWVWTRRIKHRGTAREGSLPQATKKSDKVVAMSPMSAMMRLAAKFSRKTRTGKDRTYWEEGTQASSARTLGLLTREEPSQSLGSKWKTKLYSLWNQDPRILNDSEWQKDGHQLAYIVLEKEEGGTRGKYDTLKWEVLTPTGRRVNLVDQQGQTMLPEQAEPPKRENQVAFRPKKNSKDAEYASVRVLPNYSTTVDVQGLTEEQIVTELKKEENGGRISSPGISGRIRDARTTAAIVLRKGTKVYVAGLADQLTSKALPKSLDGTERGGLTVQFFRHYDRKRKVASVVPGGANNTSALLQDVLDQGYEPVSVIRFGRHGGWRIFRQGGINRQTLEQQQEYGDQGLQQIKQQQQEGIDPLAPGYIDVLTFDDPTAYELWLSELETTDPKIKNISQAAEILARSKQTLKAQIVGLLRGYEGLTAKDMGYPNLQTEQARLRSLEGFLKAIYARYSFSSAEELSNLAPFTQTPGGANAILTAINNIVGPEITDPAAEPQYLSWEDVYNWLEEESPIVSGLIARLDEKHELQIEKEQGFEPTGYETEEELLNLLDQIPEEDRPAFWIKYHKAHIGNILFDRDAVYKEPSLPEEQKQELLSWLEDYVNKLGGVDPLTLKYSTISELVNAARGKMEFRLEDNPALDPNLLDQQTREKYFNIASALQNSGVDIKVFQRDLESAFGFLRRLGGRYDQHQKIVSLVLESVLNPDKSGLLSIAHEAAHHMLWEMPSTERQKLLDAISSAKQDFAEKHLRARQERLKRIASANPELAGLAKEQMSDPTELLVEAVAKRLAESDSALNPGFVRGIFEKIKELFYRVLTAINSATNILPDHVAADIAANYLEARMRQWIGETTGTTDYLTHLQGANTSASQKIGEYTEVHASDPYVIQDHLNPNTGKIRRQEAAPGSPGAIEANGIHAFTQPIQRYTMEVPRGTNDILWNNLALPMEGASISDLAELLGSTQLQEEVSNGEVKMGLPKVSVVPLSNAQMRSSYPNKVAVYHQGAIFIARDFAHLGDTPINETQSANLLEAQKQALAEIVGHEYTHHLSDSVFSEARASDISGKTPNKFTRMAKQTVEDWTALLKAVRKALENTPDAWQYGLTSVEEFVSEARNNREFQEILKGVALPDSLVKKFKVKGKAWDAFSMAFGRMTAPAASAAVGASNLFSRMMQAGAEIQSDRKYTSFADKLRTWTKDMSATERMLFMSQLNSLHGRLASVPTIKTGETMLEMRQVRITPEDYVEVTTPTEYDGVMLEPNTRYLLAYPRSDENKTPPLSRAWSPSQHLSQAGQNYTMEGVPADEDMWRLFRTPSLKKYFGEWDVGYRGVKGEQEVEGVMWPRQEKTNEPMFVWHSGPGAMGDTRVFNKPTDHEGFPEPGFEDMGRYETPVSAHNVGREYAGAATASNLGIGGADTKHGVMYTTTSTSSIAHLGWRNRLWGGRQTMPMIANRLFSEYLTHISDSLGKGWLTLGPDFATYKGQEYDPTPLHLTSFIQMDESISRPYPINTLAFSRDPNDKEQAQLADRNKFGGRLFHIPGNLVMDEAEVGEAGNHGYVVVHTSDGTFLTYKLKSKIPTISTSARSNGFIDPDSGMHSKVAPVIRASELQEITEEVSSREVQKHIADFKREYEETYREELDRAQDLMFPDFYEVTVGENQTWQEAAERFRVSVDDLITANSDRYNLDRAEPKAIIGDAHKGVRRTTRIRIPISENSRYVESPAIAIFTGIRNPLVLNKDNEQGFVYDASLWGNAALAAQHAYVPSVTPNSNLPYMHKSDDLGKLWSIPGGDPSRVTLSGETNYASDPHLSKRVPVKGISTVVDEVGDTPFKRKEIGGQPIDVLEVTEEALSEHVDDMATDQAVEKLVALAGDVSLPNLHTGQDALPMLARLILDDNAVSRFAREGMPEADTRVAVALSILDLSKGEIYGIGKRVKELTTDARALEVFRADLLRAADMAGMSVHNIYRLAEAKFLMEESYSGSDRLKNVESGSHEVAGLKMPASYLTYATRISEGRTVTPAGSLEATHKNIFYIGGNAFQMEEFSKEVAQSKVLGSKLLNMAQVFNPPANLLHITDSNRWMVVRPVGVGAETGAPAGNSRTWGTAAQWVGVNIDQGSITNFALHFPFSSSPLNLAMYMGDTAVGVEGGLVGQTPSDDMISKEKAFLINISNDWVKFAYRNSGYDVSAIADKTVTSISITHEGLPGKLSTSQTMSLAEAMAGTESHEALSPRMQVLSGASADSLNSLATRIDEAYSNGKTISAESFPMVMNKSGDMQSSQEHKPEGNFIPGIEVEYQPDFYSERAGFKPSDTEVDVERQLEAEYADHLLEGGGYPISQLQSLSKDNSLWNINSNVKAILINSYTNRMGESRSVILMRPGGRVATSKGVSPFVDVPTEQILTTKRTREDLEDFLGQKISLNIHATTVGTLGISDQPKTSHFSYRYEHGLPGTNKTQKKQVVETGEFVVEKTYSDGSLTAQAKVASEILGSSIASYITNGRVPIAYRHTKNRKQNAQPFVDNANDFTDEELNNWPSEMSGGTPTSPSWMKNDLSMVLELVSHMLADYVINNRDAHAGNFMYDSAGVDEQRGLGGPLRRGIIATDKGQAFKFNNSVVEHHRRTTGEDTLSREMSRHVGEEIEEDVDSWARRFYKMPDNPASVYAQFIQEIRDGSVRSMIAKSGDGYSAWRSDLATRLIKLSEYFRGSEKLDALGDIAQEFSNKEEFKKDMASEIAERSDDALAWLDRLFDTETTETNKEVPSYSPLEGQPKIVPDSEELLAALLSKKGELEQASTIQQQRDLDPLRTLLNKAGSDYTKHLVDIATKSARSDVSAQEYDGVVFRRTGDTTHTLEDQVVILHPGNPKNEGGIASVQNQGDFNMEGGKYGNPYQYRLDDEQGTDSSDFTEYDGQQAAANAMLLETYREAFRAATSKGYKKSFTEFMKKFLPHNPEGNIQAIAEYNPGAAGARISDYDGNAAMTDRILRFAAELHSQAYFKTVKKSGKVADSIESLDDEIQELSQNLAAMLNRYKDADLQEQAAQKEIRNIIKDYKRNLDGKLDLTEARSALLSVIQEVDPQIKGNDLTQAYRQAFEKLYDGDISVYDYIQDMAKLDLDFNTVEEADIITAITQSDLPTMQRLKNNKPLMSVLITFSKDNALQMSLLEARVSKNLQEVQEIEAELKRVDGLSKENLNKLRKSIKAGRKQSSKLFKVRDAYVTLKSKINRKVRRGDELRRRQATLEVAIKAIKPRHEELVTRLGVGWEFQAVPGQKFYMMQRLDDGTWLRNEAVYSNAPTDENRALLNKAKYWNKEFLRQMAEQGKADTPFATMIQKQLDELSKAIVHREYQTIHKNIIDRHLNTLEQRARALGQNGVAIARMIATWRRITAANWNKVGKLSAVWEEAYSTAISQSGMSKEVFKDLVYDTGIYWIENMPALANDPKMLYRAVYNKIRGSLSPAVTNKFGKGFEESLQKLWEKTEDITRLEDEIGNAEGVLVEDPSVQIAHPVTGEKVNLTRRRIKYGRITIPRRMKSSMLSMLTKVMVKSGWRDSSIFSRIKGWSENSNISPDEAFARIMNEVTVPNESGRALLSEDIKNDAIITHFLAPLLDKPGDPIFTAPREATGPAKKPIPQELVSSIWNESESFSDFVLNLFLEYNANPADLPMFARSIVERLRNIYQMARKVADKVDKDPLSESTSFGPHHMMDARTNTTFPREWLEYASFTKVETGIHLSKLASVGAFGRDNSLLRAYLEQAQEEQRANELPLAELQMSPEYTKLTTNKQRLRFIKENLGKEGAEQALKAEKGLEQIKRLGDDLVDLFSAPGAGFKDMKASEEFIQTAAALQLNTVKSGLWNLMSGTDWTTRLGYGSMSAKSTAKFFYESLKQGFNSLLEGVGLGIVRASEAEKVINFVRSHPGQHDLTYRALLSNKGVHGTGAGVIKYARGLQSVMNRDLGALLPFRKRKDSDRGSSGRTPFNLLTAPFNWISNVAGMGISLTMVDNYRNVVTKALQYLQSDPDAINDPSFRFTLRNLKIATGFFGGNTKALEYMENAWAERTGESLNDLVRRAGQRINEGAEMFTPEDYLTMHQIATDDISLEGGIGSHPVSLRTSPLLRFGSPLLKWATSKVNAVHGSLQTPEGRYTTQSVLKGLAGLAAWTMPIGVMASMLMDEYDEEILGKKSNLRPVKPGSAMPFMGVYEMFSDPGGEGLAVLERIARSGNTYGVGAEAIYGMASWTDPTQGQRSLGANRILAYSQISQARDSILNIVHGGYYVNYTDMKGLTDIVFGQYPVAFQQTVNNLVGPTFENERRRTKRIDAHAYLRGAARAVGMPLRKGGYKTSPTPLTARVRAMQMAAYGDDPVKFNDILRETVAMLAKDGVEDPMKKIAQSWKMRSPLMITGAKLDEEELEQLYGVMNKRGRENVADLISLHEQYLGYLDDSDALAINAGPVYSWDMNLQSRPTRSRYKYQRITQLGL